MKLGCYGYDAVFGNLFPPIAAEAEKRGYEKPIVLPYGVRGIAAERKDEMRGCDVGLVGLSSYQTQEELELLDALKWVVIIADVPTSELRPKAQQWVQAQRDLPRSQRKLKGLLLALEASRDGAIRFGYPAEDIYHLGPPPHWGVSYRQMVEIDAQTVRAGLCKRHGDGEPQSLTAEDFLVYVPGTKITPVVNAMLRSVIQVGREILGDRFALGFVRHPGERPESPKEETPFAEAMEERQHLLEGLTRVDLYDVTNPQRYAVADRIVYSVGPNESIAGAFARNDRMVYYRDENTIAALAASGSEGGKWFVAELGASYVITPQTYREGLRFFFGPDGPASVRAKQEEHFPLPETWDTAPAIVDFLEEIAAR